MPLAPMRECATDWAFTSVCFRAGTELISGFGAPARTATPTPELPSSMRLAGTTLPCRASSSMPSAVRITMSALSPSAIDLSSACVAWNWTRSPGAASSSTPFMASVLSMEISLKGGFEGDIDVIGASVHVAEDLLLAESARAVRGADADVGLARHAHVEARIEIAEELPVAAAAPALVVELHLGDLLRIRKAGSDADARAHPAIPPEAVPIRLEARHRRPEVVLVALLEMALQADEAGEVDRPAARALD